MNIYFCPTKNAKILLIWSIQIVIMDILFFAFANDRDKPLPALEAEDEAIYSLLAPRQAQSHFVIHRDQSVSIEKLAEFLILYRNDIVLFHYSGHAGKDHLSLDDETASAYGIAELLGSCPRLQLVILNGCSTAGQVGRLLEKKVPLVIATSSSIEDEKAKNFAIQFYRSLTQSDTIHQAFDAARAKILTINDAIPFYRDTSSFDAPENPVWGIFHAQDVNDTSVWTLPFGSSQTFGSYTVVNDLLLNTLIAALAPFNVEVNRIWEREAEGESKSILDKREAILKCLPHPISEQVRKLLVPGDAGGQIYYDQAGLPRLSQMATVYDTIMELTGFILLAQLWEALSHSDALKIDDEVKKQVKAFLRLNALEREHFNFIPLIKAIQKFLNDNQIKYFIDELEHISGVFKEGEVFFEACQFLDSIKEKVYAKKIGDKDAILLSTLAEEKLAQVLQELGFIARYTFASVKNIGVVKYRHSKQAKFKHHLVKLVQRFVGLEEEVKIMEDFMDTASILLIKELEDSTEFLNLSPFVLDENAFDEKATIAKLYYFDQYNRDNDVYSYRHVYKPQDPRLMISNQLNYRIVKVQFEAFAQMLFDHPMRQVL